MADLLEQFLDVLPDAVLLLDERFAIRVANAGAGRFLGERPRELVGRSVFDFVADEAGAVRGFLRQASTTTQPLPGRLRLKTAEGPRLLNAYAAALRNGDGRLIALRCVERHEASRIFQALEERLQMVSSELHRERRLQIELQEALKERETLLGEVHHRVRNNLQITSSMLNLQMSSLGPGPAQTALREMQARVQALALVHNRVYSEGSLDQINLARLLPGLSQTIVDLFGASQRITVSSSLPDWRLAVVRASPLALLVSEAITNALKHAFPDDRPGTITLDGRMSGERRVLRVADDGVGMDVEARQRERRSVGRRSVGLSLMRGLATQLEADLAIDGRQGVEIRLTFVPTTDWR